MRFVARRSTWVKAARRALFMRRGRPPFQAPPALTVPKFKARILRAKSRLSQYWIGVSTGPPPPVLSTPIPRLDTRTRSSMVRVARKAIFGKSRPPFVALPPTKVPSFRVVHSKVARSIVIAYWQAFPMGVTTSRARTFVARARSAIRRVARARFWGVFNTGSVPAQIRMQRFFTRARGTVIRRVVAKFWATPDPGFNPFRPCLATRTRMVYRKVIRGARFVYAPRPRPVITSVAFFRTRVRDNISTHLVPCFSSQILPVHFRSFIRLRVRPGWGIMTGGTEVDGGSAGTSGSLLRRKNSMLPREYMKRKRHQR